MQSATQPRPNSSPSATHFAANNFSNMTTWMPAAATFQVPTGMPKTPATPGPPGIASSVPSPSSSAIQASSLDSTVLLRTFMPTAPVLSNHSIQHNAVAMYPSAPPQAAPPGQWLQPQHISGFARPSFSPYTPVIPGPYPMPTRSIPPPSVSYPDIQPPGVSPVVSAIGAPTASFTGGSQSSVGLGQAELPPRIGKPQKFTFSFKYHCIYGSAYFIVP